MRVFCCEMVNGDSSSAFGCEMVGGDSSSAFCCEMVGTGSFQRLPSWMSAALANVLRRELVAGVSYVPSGSLHCGSWDKIDDRSCGSTVVV